jgi:SAM-dependent methyltransferase
LPTALSGVELDFYDPGAYAGFFKQKVVYYLTPNARSLFFPRYPSPPIFETIMKYPPQVQEFLDQLGKSLTRKRLYKRSDFLDAYRRHTDLRVQADPQDAVGGMWEEMGKLQIDFLITKGLKSHHKLLDIGCGTLRGGRHIIKYLDSGNYYGIDISKGAIDHARTLVNQENLNSKKPILIVNENMNLKFSEFEGNTFDFLLAQSVFTHLPPEHIEECLAHIREIMHEKSVFYFTYHSGKKYSQKGSKGFRYPFCFFETLAGQFGFKLRDESKAYAHPRGQRMAEFKMLPIFGDLNASRDDCS